MKYRRSWTVILGTGLLAVPGCKSAHVEVTVQNHTGADVRLLEVDYPNASFGFDAIPAGGSKHYRIQVEGTGNVTVQYTGPNDKQFKSTGPELHKDLAGSLKVILEAGGKAEFTQGQ